MKALRRTLVKGTSNIFIIRIIARDPSINRYLKLSFIFPAICSEKKCFEKTNRNNTRNKNDEIINAKSEMNGLSWSSLRVAS